MTKPGFEAITTRRPDLVVLRRQPSVVCPIENLRAFLEWGRDAYSQVQGTIAVKVPSRQRRPE